MDQQQIIVKTEVQSNGEILLFYVDENGDNEEGVITTVENIENQALQLQEADSYIIQDVGDLPEDNIPQTSLQIDDWTDDEIKRLLVFFNDNKPAFITGTTKKTHLWTVACKTMLIGKTPTACEQKLSALQLKYYDIISQIQKGVYTKWPYFELCHQVFEDDSSEEFIISDVPMDETKLIKVPVNQNNENDKNIMVIKTVNTNKATTRNVDEKVVTMLNLYLKHRKDFQKEYWRKGLWETIAMEIGEDNGEYWQKRFLNYKQHYQRLLDKRRITGPEGINWPYMELFDQIFEGEQDLSRKKEYKPPEPPKHEEIVIDWNNTELTVLVKYYFDCYDEFEDQTIPNNFLWNEIGRLLDKKPNECHLKYEELKSAHLEKYIAGGYDIKTRKPIEILFDNIICKDLESQLLNFWDKTDSNENFSNEEIDTLVQFFYDNVDMYKDTICHFVCWSAIAKKLNKTPLACRNQWQDLVTLYKSVLNDKMENPDVQFEWQYIDTFDRIFDYGMDTNLLAGYEKKAEQKKNIDSKIGVKKINIKSEDNMNDEISDYEDDYVDERGIRRRNNRQGESKAIKILEYYQKNKEKFLTTNKNKHSLWEILAKQIGITATQCAHRFRNLKQVYTAYVQREINKPDMPILWPYYALCKKVFGYRAIKSMLKNGKAGSDTEDWSAKEIKQLIKYFSTHFDEIDSNTEDVSKWAELSSEIDKSQTACKEKFLELRKSYRKLKTMKSKNPDTNIMWKYYKMFEDIYNGKEGMDVDYENSYLEIPMSDEVRLEGDEDYQCIIVMPEGQDLSQIENAQIIIQEQGANMETSQDTIEQQLSKLMGHTEDIVNAQIVFEAPQENIIPSQETNIERKPIVKWTKRSKKRLIVLYINYVRSHKGQEIKSKEMWAEIAQKLGDKSPISCRKMFVKLKAIHKKFDEADVNTKKPSYYNLMEKVMRLKPKFAKIQQNKELKESVGKIYKDVILPDEKVQQALEYYLKNLDDFISPRFEKKYLWTELANHVSEPVTKVFNKINYLKQSFNIETLEVAGQVSPFSGLLKEILEREVTSRLALESQPKPVVEESDLEEAWNDDETELLLQWYLSNLEKFKNPKFVRSYLWMDASNILNKTALSCSKKMSEIRTQYRNMVRETPELLGDWRFLGLCQKIYGTGKKGCQNN